MAARGFPRPSHRARETLVTQSRNVPFRSPPGGNLPFALHNRLRGSRCRPHGPSLKIEILEQTSQAATVFTRMHGIWANVIVDGDAELAMPEIGISVPLTEFYLDVEFPPDEENL